jgi:hypothetical protein
VVDGLNITNGGYGALGSYSVVFGSLGNGTPYDFMQEVQVKTGGYEAEFGQATGVALEDVQPYPMVATSLGLPGAASANYLLTNPGPNTPVVQDIPGATVAFESPVHDYNAVEFTANKRLADGWSLAASYRWSRLTGTYEGFFRNDNGQSDPGRIRGDLGSAVHGSTPAEGRCAV